MKTCLLWFALNCPPAPPPIDLHLPPQQRKNTSFDLRLMMNNQYFFQSGLASWSTIAINGRFVFPVKNMNIAVNIRLPGIINGISLKL